MLQRIQTVYLLLAVILLAAGCCMTLAVFEPEGMGTAVKMNTICLAAPGAVSYLPVTLLVLTGIAVLLAIAAIFGYKDLKRQATHCSFTILTLLLWLVNYSAYVLLLAPAATVFRPGVGALMPCLALVLVFLARKGVNADRKLLRDAERFR